MNDYMTSNGPRTNGARMSVLLVMNKPNASATSSKRPFWTIKWLAWLPCALTRLSYKLFNRSCGYETIDLFYQSLSVL